MAADLRLGIIETDTPCATKFTRIPNDTTAEYHVSGARTRWPETLRINGGQDAKTEILQ
jgi:hypothetical protein